MNLTDIGLSHLHGISHVSVDKAMDQYYGY